MDSHETATELGQPGATVLLTSATLARLGYDGIDGFPRVIPIGFFWSGKAVVMCTATTSPKVGALIANPRVALSIDTGSTPAEAKSLLIRGTATTEVVDGVPEEFIAASAKTLSDHERADFAKASASMYTQMVRISVTPDWARFYDFGAGRMPSFLTELATHES